MKYYIILTNVLFYLLGVYHFNTFNVLEFWEVESIIYGHPNWASSLKFLIGCELILIGLSYVLKKSFEK